MKSSPTGSNPVGVATLPIATIPVGVFDPRGLPPSTRFGRSRVRRVRGVRIPSVERAGHSTDVAALIGTDEQPHARCWFRGVRRPVLCRTVHGCASEGVGSSIAAAVPHNLGRRSVTARVELRSVRVAPMVVQRVSTELELRFLTLTRFKQELRAISVHVGARRSRARERAPSRSARRAR